MTDYSRGMGAEARRRTKTVPNVHTRHCCKQCGCKYGYTDCPVVTGEQTAEYPCSDCSETASALDSAACYLFDNFGASHWCAPWEDMTEATRERWRGYVRETVRRANG